MHGCMNGEKLSILIHSLNKTLMGTASQAARTRHRIIESPEYKANHAVEPICHFSLAARRLYSLDDLVHNAWVR